MVVAIDTDNSRNAPLDTSRKRYRLVADTFDGSVYPYPLVQIISTSSGFVPVK